MLNEVIIGFLFAVFSVFLIRKLYPKKDHAFWRLGLLVAAFIYVIFALVVLDIEWLATELGGLAAFGLFVWLSKQYSLLWLALGWGLHVTWDILLHPNGHPGYVPEWYPGVCLGFDIAIAAYIVAVFIERKQLKLSN